MGMELKSVHLVVVAKLCVKTVGEMDIVASPLLKVAKEIQYVIIAMAASISM